MSLINLSYSVSFPVWWKGCDGRKQNAKLFYHAISKLVHYTEIYMKFHLIYAD